MQLFRQALVAVVVTAACTHSRSSGDAGTDAGGGGLEKIQHIVIIMQENRSFDHYFGTFPGAEGIPTDAAGNFTVFNIDPTTGAKVYPFHTTVDSNAGGPHGSTNATADIDGGKMDGFVSQQLNANKNC